MKICPNCKTTSIPNNANFCPNCGMWLSHEGLIITLASEPEGIHWVGGGYTPSAREQKVLDYIKDEDNKIPETLWEKYDKIVSSKKPTNNGVLWWGSNHTEIANSIMQTIDNKLKHQYGVEGDWVVNEQMFHEYKESHSLLLRVGGMMYSILIIYNKDGINIVRCKERLWQEVECKRNGYIPCFAYVELRRKEIPTLKNNDIFHAITNKPIVFANAHKDKDITPEEIILLAIREFTKENHLVDYGFYINKNDVHIYNRERYKEAHFILEVNDLWGENWIAHAKELREKYCSKNIIAPKIFKINIHSNIGGSPTYNDYICNIELSNFFENLYGDIFLYGDNLVLDQYIYAKRKK